MPAALNPTVIGAQRRTNGKTQGQGTQLASMMCGEVIGNGRSSRRTIGLLPKEGMLWGEHLREPPCPGVRNE